MNASWMVAALLFAGWAGLCLARARHFHAVYGRVGHATRRRAIGVAGASLLAAAFAVAVRAHGWEFGPVLWTALLSLGALAWVLLLALNARRAPWLLLVLALAMGLASVGWPA